MTAIAITNVNPAIARKVVAVFPEIRQMIKTIVVLVDMFVVQAMFRMEHHLPVLQAHAKPPRVLLDIVRRAEAAFQEIRAPIRTIVAVVVMFVVRAMFRRGQLLAVLRGLAKPPRVLQDIVRRVAAA